MPLGCRAVPLARGHREAFLQWAATRLGGLAISSGAASWGRGPLQSKREKFVAHPFRFARYGVDPSCICVFWIGILRGGTIRLPRANCLEISYRLNTVEESQLKDAALSGTG
jgi:hypothetical protein